VNLRAFDQDIIYIYIYIRKKEREREIKLLQQIQLYSYSLFSTFILPFALQVFSLSASSLLIIIASLSDLHNRLYVYPFLIRFSDKLFVFFGLFYFIFGPELAVWLAQLVTTLAAPTHVRSCVQEVRVRSPERTSSTLASVPPGWVK